MSSKSTTSNLDVVLLSWVSVNAKAAPILTAIRHPKSPYCKRIRALYLCYRDFGDGKEKGVFEETQKQLQDDLDKKTCPEIVGMPWKTNASPTDHVEIKVFAEGALTRVRKENPTATIAIHLSPGTPAMHAVWLLLGSTGFVDGEVQLLQTNPEDAQKQGAPPVQFVNIPLDTWFKQFRAARPAVVSSEDAGHLWDPTRCKSHAMREMLAKLELYAPLRVPVLLLGERGSGKTTLANLLRAKSGFQKPNATHFPAVVCGEFRDNPQLARAELFGYKKGAFTDATEDRPGLLDHADGDTLFLDEVGDLDRKTQRMLMAAVEGRGFRRVGDNSEKRKSNFRLVCATNRTLVELRGGLLDLDFLDRIAVFTIYVPPLRDCREDLPDLWAQVLRKAVADVGHEPRGWERFLSHDSFLAELQTHPLPGNVRSLQRAAYHLLAALSGERGEPEILESMVSALDDPGGNDIGLADQAETHVRVPIDNLDRHLVDYQARWLQAAMENAGGNKSKAARLLGLERKTFDYRWKTMVEDKGGEG